MFTKVVKFGGTSMADAANIRKVADIVLSDPSRRIVVVSAPGKRNKGDEKITDMLYAAHNEVRGGGKVGDTFFRIESRYKEIAAELGLKTDIAGEFKKIKAALENNGTKDYAASRGEYLAGLIMAAVLDFEFIDAASIIKFKADGAYDPEYTNDIAGARLNKVKKGVVVPGFYGAMPDGGIKTFSRGGSDITGSILARAGGVMLYENWTDVDGFLTCDPKIVEKPKLIDELTYVELRELAYMGAAVLHPDSIFPVRYNDIPINIKNTFNPSYKGTMIVARQSHKTGRTVTGIAGKKGFTNINIEKSMMNNELGFLRKILSVMENMSISVEHIPSGIDTVSIIVETSSLQDREDAVREALIAAVDPDEIEFTHDLALIATVGHGMAKRKGTASRLFAALSKADINVRMIDQGSSELNIIVGVDAADFEKAVNSIYKEFYIH